MMQCLNTGHDGSMSTGHANSAADMLSRLENMIMMGMDIPLAAIRQQIASGVDLIVHLGRLRDRSRKVLEIAEVLGYEEDKIDGLQQRRAVRPGRGAGPPEPGIDAAQRHRLLLRHRLRRKYLRGGDVLPPDRPLCGRHLRGGAEHDRDEPAQYRHSQPRPVPGLPPAPGLHRPRARLGPQDGLFQGPGGRRQAGPPQETVASVLSGTYPVAK